MTTLDVSTPRPSWLSRFVSPLLRENVPFRRFFAGQAVSLVGDQVSGIALPLVGVLVLHAGAAEMGYLTTAGLLPNLLSLHAGAWVDRRGRRRQTMLAADVGRAILLASVPIAYGFDALTLAQLYVVSALIGVLSVFFYVSYSSLFVALVPRGRYVEANSLLHGSRALSFVGGPSLGGLIVQVLSAPAALIVDAFSFVVSAFQLNRISPEEPATEPVARGHLRGGWQFIRRTPIVWFSLLATSTLNFFNFVFFALFILYATRSLHVQPGLLGVVLGAGAVGGVIGSIITGRVGRRIGIGRAYALGCFVFPASLILVPLASGPRWVVLSLLFLAEFGSGVGVMLLDISSASITQSLVPDRLRSRVSGAYMVVNYGVRPIGAFLGGVLGAEIGLRPTLWIATIGGVACVLWLLPSPILHLHEPPEQVE